MPTTVVLSADDRPDIVAVWGWQPVYRADARALRLRVGSIYGTSIGAILDVLPCSEVRCAWIGVSDGAPYAFLLRTLPDTITDAQIRALELAYRGDARPFDLQPSGTLMTTIRGMASRVDAALRAAE